MIIRETGQKDGRSHPQGLRAVEKSPDGSSHLESLRALRTIPHPAKLPGNLNYIYQVSLSGTIKHSVIYHTFINTLLNIFQNKGIDFHFREDGESQSSLTLRLSTSISY